MPKKIKNKFYSLIVFSLIILFNPTANIIDIFPDFIAWFILAKLFEKAADSASYFEEARSAFIRLGIISAAKIPAFILVLLIEKKSGIGNDTYALASLIFSTLEIIFIIPAVKYIFEALFHLGERSDAKSLIAPITTPENPNRALTPESVRGLTFLFFICKALLTALPDLLLLTRVTGSGHVVTFSRFYPITLVIAFIAQLSLGIIWLRAALKYIRKIRDEKLFLSSLEKIATESSAERFEAKIKMRKMYFALSFLGISALPSLELVFGDFNGINILPRFIYGLCMIFSVILIGRYTKKRRIVLISASTYTLFALLAFIFQTRFLLNFEYIDLTMQDAARKAYFLVEIFGILEFVSLVFMLVIFTRYLLCEFIFENTGVHPTSERYRRTEREYHINLIKRAYLLCIFGIIGGLARMINIFLNRDVQIIFSDITDITRPTFSASALPWFNLVVTATAIIYIGYSLYFTSTLKEEVTIKNTI